MPEGNDSIERCPAVLNPAIWDDPVSVGSRQATVYLLEVSILSRYHDHDILCHLALRVLSTPGLVSATDTSSIPHQHEAMVTFV